MFIRRWKIVERDERKRKVGDSQKKGNKDRRGQPIGTDQLKNEENTYSAEIDQEEERKGMEEILTKIR